MEAHAIGSRDGFFLIYFPPCDGTDILESKIAHHNTAILLPPIQPKQNGKPSLFEHITNSMCLTYLVLQNP